jgi:hypothetical protein
MANANAGISLREFFIHKLREGPLDGTFKPAPEVKADPAAGGEPGMDPEMDPVAGPGGEPQMTQDVAPAQASELSFFSANAQSAVGKFEDLQSEGFDSQALIQFAGAMDALVAQIYQVVQDPSERQDFEVEAQKVAADFSKDLAKLFDNVLSLKAYGNQY